MSIEDIMNIVGTVAVTQFLCDMASNYFVYHTDHYQRLLGRLHRTRCVLEKEEVRLQQQAASGNISSTAVILTEKQKRKWVKAKEEAAQAATDVAAKRTWPMILTSMIFLLLYRIFAMEYNSKVMAVIPFVPWRWIQRFTTIQTTTTTVGLDTNVSDLSSLDASRGVTSVHQACSFFFLYLLCTLSIKFYINKMFGTPSPPNVTLLSLVDAPSNQKILKQFQLDNESMAVAAAANAATGTSKLD